MSTKRLERKARKRIQSQAATKEKQRLRARADKIWQQCIRLMHPSCEMCGAPMNEGHHFFAKGSCSALRYDLENGIGLCARCHHLHNLGKAIVDVPITRLRGDDWYDELFGRKEALTKRSKEYYEDEIERLTERLRELEGET